MKAVRAHTFGGPENLRLDEIPTPEPGPDEVLIEVRAAGVNPADTYMLTGNYAIRPELPYIPGGDCAGVVAALGPEVRGLNVGDRVFVSAALGARLSGCYAEYVVRPAATVVALPDGIDFQQAAGIGVPYVTAHLALFSRGRAKRSETVFIHGASGAVGTAAIQLAQRSGLRIIGSAGSKAGLARVAEAGAELAVDHMSEGYLATVRDATDGKGPELILEMLANENLGADMELAAKHGRIVIVGCRGDVTVSPRLAMMKELDILGAAIWNAPIDQVREMLEDIVAGLTEGGLVPFVGKRFPLSKAADAHDAVLRPGSNGKIVLLI